MVTNLIEGLPKRSMDQLQQQWINVLRKIDKSPSRELRRFREAVAAEWAARYRRALDDPDYFEWPSTAARPGNGGMSFAEWHEEGVLSYIGYHVGTNNGATDGVRRQILDFAFTDTLPPVNSMAYIRDWAPPASAARLERLANELARFARNAKRKRTADMSSAIADWEADLRYLHRKYYVGKFGFGWPLTS
jgi:hypothetical protein